jgi:aminomethyltransferase
VGALESRTNPPGFGLTDGVSGSVLGIVRESLRFSTEGAHIRAGWRGGDSAGGNVTDSDELKFTPLDALHRELGAKMVPFGGYAMPVQYPTGILTEHLHTRRSAGLFDVSHMGQVRLTGDGTIAAIERLVPGDIQALKPGRIRYTMLTNAQGGIIDDLMIARRESELALVVNAGTKDNDIAHIAANLPTGVKLIYEDQRALLALQGPLAATVLERHIAGISNTPFMTEIAAKLAGIDITLTRSGYTGEDGFELSIPADRADQVARLLLAAPEVLPIGLGARDSLRLEAGLCLYGHDIDEVTTPIEADLIWTISKRRRAEGGFPGDAVIQKQITEGPARRRVGIQPEGRAPAREGVEIQIGGQVVGKITSGGFGPSADRPVAMGYVDAAHAITGTAVDLIVRGKPLPARIVTMPFVPHSYFK